MRLTRAASFLLLGTALLAQAHGQQYAISTYAGGAPPPTPTLSIDQAIGNASSLASDYAGNVYFVSFNCVFRLDGSGVITRVAGISAPGYSGDGGPAIDAQLSRPGGLALDGAGNLFVADLDNHRVRKVSAGGIITTVAGNGLPGFSGDGRSAIDAQLYLPAALAVDGKGNLFILDWGNTHGSTNPPDMQAGNRVRRVSPDGIITTVAGNGAPGFSGDGGPGTGAQLSRPDGIAADGAGNLFIADTYNQRIRKVSSDGIITTVVNSRESNPDCLASLSPLLLPGFSFGYCGPMSVALDREGNLFFYETGFDDFLDAVTYLPRLRKLSPDGIITTVAGNDTQGYSGDGGPASSATGVWGPLAVDGAGNLFIASGGHIRKISPDGIIVSVAGNGKYLSEPVNGIPTTSAHLSSPTEVAVDGAGNLFIKEVTGIRKVSTSGIITTVVSAVPCVYSWSAITTGGDQTPCIGTGMAADSAGNLFFQDYFRIRKLSPDGTIITVVGNGIRGYSGDGGPGVDAQLSSAVDGLAVDGAGNLFIGDDLNRRVRRVSPDGIITTVAGNGTLGHSGDGERATSAALYAPGWVTVDGTGNLFIAEIGNIRKVSNGIITTITGNGGPSAGYSGDGGPASSATGVSGPLAVDGTGNLFIAFGGHVRKISPDGIITTLDGVAGSSIAADRAGNVYIADPSNNVIRILRPINGPF